MSGGMGGGGRETGGVASGSRISSLMKRVAGGDVGASIAIREMVQKRGDPNLELENLMSEDGARLLCKALTNRKLPQRKRLLDSLLSTLGDCSLERDFRAHVLEQNISSELVFILKHTTEDNIVRKCCRVIGNLALSDKNAKQLHSEGVIIVLQDILENDKLKVSTLTLTSAVRAVRLLWVLADYQKDMLQAGIVKSVLHLFHLRCLKAEIVTKKCVLKNMKSDIFTGLLKCIGYFTVNATSQCIEYFISNEQVLPCLVLLTKIYESLAMQSILNLCYDEQCHPLLGAAGAVELLIDNLESQTNWPSSWIRALSLLCRASVNRLKLVQHGGLCLLLTIIKDKDSSKLSCHLYALQTLLLFYYDSDALKILTDDGAIPVFTNLLKQYVDIMEYEHQPDSKLSKIAIKSDSDLQSCSNSNNILDNGKNLVHIEDDNMNETPLNNEHEGWDSCDEISSPFKKIKYDHSSEPKVKSWLSLKHQSPNLSPHSDYSSANTSSLSPEYNTRNQKNCPPSTSSGCSLGSPSSSIDGITSNYWNPYYSSPSSISQYGEDSVDSDWSAHYSPVCSDEDDRLTIVSIDMDCTSESNLLVDDLVNEDGVFQESMKNSDLNQINQYKIRGLLNLLYAFTNCQNNMINKITSCNLLITLLNFIKKYRYPSKNIAVRIFNKILSEYTSLEHLLKQSIVFILYDALQKPKHEKCKQCKQVNKIFSKFNSQILNIAESDYGVGIICHQLIKGENCVKENLVLTLPFIIRSSRVLKKFFVNCEALELFLTILSSYKKPIEYCVPALSKLAANLSIPPPKPVFAEFKSFIISKYDPVLSEDTEVVFVLDDSSVISANANVLCEYSDVFVAMLHGEFKEAHQKYVKIREVSRESLEYLFILLEAGVHLKSIDVFPLPQTIDVALETLLLTDRFLMDEVKNLLFSAIVQFKLDTTTADKIYIWSLKEGMGTLCMESVAFTLVGEMSNSERCCIVMSIMKSIYKEQWIDDIRYSLLRFMV